MVRSFPDRLNPMGMAWQLAQRLADRGWHGRGSWLESTPWHKLHGFVDTPGQRHRWHDYAYSFDAPPDDLERATEIWGYLASAVRRRYRRRIVLRVLMGYESGDRVTPPHTGDWRVLSTVLESRNLDRQAAHDLVKYIDRYGNQRDDKLQPVLRGIGVFAEAPRYWRGWIAEGKRCETEWKNGRRFG